VSASDLSPAVRTSRPAFVLKRMNQIRGTIPKLTYTSGSLRNRISPTTGMSDRPGTLHALKEWMDLPT